jgi:hypothetical protein
VLDEDLQLPHPKLLQLGQGIHDLPRDEVKTPSKRAQ